MQREDGKINAHDQRYDLLLDERSTFAWVETLSCGIIGDKNDVTQNQYAFGRKLEKIY